MWIQASLRREPWSRCLHQCTELEVPLALQRISPCSAHGNRTRFRLRSCSSCIHVSAYETTFQEQDASHRDTAATGTFSATELACVSEASPQEHNQTFLQHKQTAWGMQSCSQICLHETRQSKFLLRSNAAQSFDGTKKSFYHRSFEPSF